MPKKARGRPKGSRTAFKPDKLSTDKDAAAVVLLDAQLRFASLREVKVTERQAAEWAVAASLAPKDIQPKFHKGPPPRRPAVTGHRNSPTKKSLLHGYNELELDIKRFGPAADRVRKKRAAWRRRPEARKWLSDRSYGLAQHLYREVIPGERLRERHDQTK
jgi:hypothetical protein